MADIINNLEKTTVTPAEPKLSPAQSEAYDNFSNTPFKVVESKNMPYPRLVLCPDGFSAGIAFNPKQAAQLKLQCGDKG